MSTMPAPPIVDIEDYLLSLVARAEGRTLQELRDEEALFPDDPPWNSEQFVRYMLEIEDHFGLEFDPIEVERQSRSLRKLAMHILDLLGKAKTQAI